MSLFRNSRGDTIAEVLISIAILSLIMSMSYTLANRSTQGVRQAQERSEAQTMAESQIESLKVYLSNPGSSLPAVGGEFCLSNDGNNITKVDISSDGNTPIPDACKSGPDNRYTTKIKRESDGLFSAKLSWPRVNGQGDDLLETWYKIYGSNGYAALDLSGIVSGGSHTGECRNLEIFDPTFNDGEGACVTTCSAGWHENTPGGLCVPDTCPGGNVLGVGRVNPSEECVPDHCKNIDGWQNPEALSAYISREASGNCFISINPNSFFKCDKVENYNQPNDGCQTPAYLSPAVFGFRNFKTYYNILGFPVEATSKPLKITISYSQNDNGYSVAPDGYNYKVSVDACNELACFGSGEMLLPADKPGIIKTHDTTFTPWVSVKTFTLKWGNNQEADGQPYPIDANLQIDKIILTW